VPGLAVLADAVSLMTIPAALAAVVGAVAGGPLARALAAAAGAWIAIVAVMAQAGFAGNPRYLVAAMAYGCVLAGAGAAWVGSKIARDAGAATAAAVLVVAVGAVTAGDLREQVSDVGARADRRTALPDLVVAAGGRDSLVGCTRVRTAPDVRPLVAWELDISMLNIDRPPEAPATVLRWSPHGGGPMEPAIPAGFELLGRVPYWEAWATCRVRR
jgi:hypothetical protein